MRGVLLYGGTLADTQLEKTYDFSSVEGRLYEWWD